MIKYPTKEQVIEFNRQVTKDYGETHALLSPANLEYAIEAVKMKYREVGEAGLVEKCALLIELLVTTHPFVDGNKRTALLCGKDFLKSNGFALRLDPPRKEAKFMLQIAMENAGPIEIRAYLMERIIKQEGNK